VSEVDTILELLDRAAETLVKTPKEERAHWVTYFFGALELLIEPEVFNDLLREVQTRLIRRIGSGKWA